MPHRHAFTLTELVVTVALFLLIAAVMLPALGTTRCRGSRQMQNNTQNRGVQSALVLYASGNNTYYVGLNSKGNVTEPTTEGRYQILLEEAYFTGDYIISPTEVLTAWTTGTLRTDQYSYAMLGITQDLPDDAEPDSPRRLHEWRDTINTEAIVNSDRNNGGPTSDKYQSVYTTDPGDWRGSIAWNDNHVTFQTTATGLKTKYAQYANTNDDLFQPDGPADAVMIHSGE